MEGVDINKVPCCTEDLMLLIKGITGEGGPPLFEGGGGGADPGIFSRGGGAIQFPPPPPQYFFLNTAHIIPSSTRYFAPYPSTYSDDGRGSKYLCRWECIGNMQANHGSRFLEGCPPPLNLLFSLLW